jgi:hypothetical protein
MSCLWMQGPSVGPGGVLTSSPPGPYLLDQLPGVTVSYPHDAAGGASAV